MTNFNERTNTLLYKNISLTLYSRKGWCWLCVRDELETGTDCHILTQSSSDHSTTSFSSWLGLLNRGSLRAQALSLQADSHAGMLSLTDSNCDWNWTELELTNLSRLWHLVIQLFHVHLLPGGIRICTEFNHVHRSRWYSDIFDRMHLFRCSSAYLHRCISWLTDRLQFQGY